MYCCSQSGVNLMAESKEVLKSARSADVAPSVLLEIEYYDSWCDTIGATMAIRPLFNGGFTAEIVGAKYLFNGRKTGAKKFVAEADTREGAVVKLFRHISVAQTCKLPKGNYNTPYYIAGIGVQPKSEE